MSPIPTAEAPHTVTPDDKRVLERILGFATEFAKFLLPKAEQGGQKIALEMLELSKDVLV